ncbi:MAG: hypothetical protein WAM64_06815 [Acidimicrobiales bacterium]
MTKVAEAKVGMLIRRPTSDVFQALVNPSITGSNGGFTCRVSSLKAFPEHNFVRRS